MEKHPNRKLLHLSIAVILVIVAALIVFSWLLTRGVEDDTYGKENANETANPSQNQSVEQEPSNPNVTGGSSAGGTEQSNDPNVPTPSPAGGVDTNNTPSTGQ